MTHAPVDAIDLERYPLLSLDGPAGRAVVDRCRASLDTDALCLLPGFLNENAVSEFLREANELLPLAIPQRNERTPYGWMDNAGFTPDHPRSARFTNRNGTVTLDMFGEQSGIRRLFFWDPLTEFVRRCLGFDTLYCSACPYLALELKVMEPGDTVSWHFDTNDGVVSLLLQPADEGGEFEYAPYIRSEEDENYPEMAKVFAGTSARVKRVAPPAGTFILFNGRRSIHRVSPIGATTKPRLILLFSYDRRPGMRFPEATVRAVINPEVRVHAGSGQM